MSIYGKKYFPFFLLFLLVFISRIPFIAAGYGVEEDSWGIALAAFHTKITGIYEPSRFPGHPVQELLYSLLWGTGPVMFNGLSAFFSAAAAVFFALILKQLNFRFYLLAALAFAFVPVFYISGTYTIDFAWSEAFVLLSFYCLLRKNFIPAGMFLGMAVGCRITSGAMLLPFMIVTWQPGNMKENLLRFFKMMLPMGIVILLAFLPLILQFGTSFFMYYDQFPYPPVTKVLYKMSLGVFGSVGIVALGWMAVLAVAGKKRQAGTLFGQRPDKKIIYAAVLIIILYVISYFRLPQKSGYMIPVIPFVILLAGYWLNARNFKVLCAALILSSFTCSINLTDKLRGAEYSSFAATFSVSGQDVFFDVLSGPVFSDYSKRKQKMNYTAEVIRAADSLRSGSVIIAGWWYNEIMVTKIGRPQQEHVIYEAYIDKHTIEAYRAKGDAVFYLPEQEIYNDEMYRMHVTAEMAHPFLTNKN